MSDGTDQQSAMDSLRAPAGPELVDKLTAERLSHPHLRAVAPQETDPITRIAHLETQLAEERAGRAKAEADANEMAVLIAGVRTELATEQQAREEAEGTAAQMAELLAKEHANVRKAKEELRLAWAQVPMVEQRDLNPGKTALGRRAKRVLGR